jgi:hypothetical protein
MQFFCCLWIIVGGMDANANVTGARDDVARWRWRTSARTHVKTRFLGGGLVVQDERNGSFHATHGSSI